MSAEIFIEKAEGAWKLVYLGDYTIKPGFYFVNAGDPKTYTPASEEVVLNAVKRLASLKQRVAELEQENQQLKERLNNEHN